MAETKTKYNSKKIELDGHVFDSKAEAKYYELLKLQQAQEKILFFRLQPRYELQASFKKNDKLHRKIEYVADFEVHHLDGSIETIDVKGFETTDFAIKRKLFEKKFPHKLSVLAFSQIDGGWIETDKLKKARKERKKAKNLPSQ
ncbi:DUF1064 domain-containing protein [Psychrobacillus lasiicapitis]|uniref:DUF1064 domain-containing protein n=1 Tax=Psychrobacillus lasiicapitis TaxID=1636719 RepID=A0A544TA84_9BACI|nr:DUF1064 domain-containing protein [Psychrobacillus lasiicapitis]TQR14374.1 DUF1064 domain-containing protein [Psychrobacillus lasiicapitis]GGA31900.1 hypothetical protein GCM10011384_21820 [Psychrobacillus lasiicapitis]